MVAAVVLKRWVAVLALVAIVVLFMYSGKGE
jgi:hypothetical protein